MNVQNLQSRTQLRIIELDCVYQQLEDPNVRKLFADLLHMRKRGYSSRHQDGALPIDTYDFIGTHYLMAIESEQGELQVVGCLRMVKASQAQNYNLPFPAVSLVTAAKANRHLEFLSGLFNRKQQANQNLDFSYVSSWSFDPIVRKDPALLQALYGLLCTINVYSHANPREEIRVACGIPRLKTDQYIRSLGYAAAEDQMGLLPEVHQANLVGEPVILFTLQDGHCVEYKTQAQANEAIWNKRMILRPETIEQKKAA